ncbi:MAG: IS110 family transposase [Candidatus Auribacterota bacterium]|nr:IS110 family transposase [Candidatus Auribacterota bacterium]
MVKYRKKSKTRKLDFITCDDSAYVGLDVHKRSIHGAVRINGNLISTFVMPANKDAVIKTLEPLAAGLEKIVYEAGPTGYSLARSFQEIGWPIEVIAPGKIPKEANQGSKSDRLDCKKLAEFAEKDMLKAVAIPTEQEEADRQLTRLRDHLKKKEKRVKQQIKSFLLQHGIKEPVSLSNWSKSGVDALAKLELNSELRFTMDIFLEELKDLKEHLKATQNRIKQISKAERFAEKVTLLETHPGVGPKTSIKFLTEVYQPGRFNEYTQVARYTGLAPRVRQSGEKRREGPLIKAGQAPLRCMLIQAAWAWVRCDPYAAMVYRRLLKNTGKTQKAITGIARRLAVNLWCMLMRGEVFRATPVSV